MRWAWSRCSRSPGPCSRCWSASSPRRAGSLAAPSTAGSRTSGQSPTWSEIIYFLKWLWHREQREIIRMLNSTIEYLQYSKFEFHQLLPIILNRHKKSHQCVMVPGLTIIMTLSSHWRNFYRVSIKQIHLLSHSQFILLGFQASCYFEEWKIEWPEGFLTNALIIVNREGDRNCSKLFIILPKRSVTCGRERDHTQHTAPSWDWDETRRGETRNSGIIYTLGNLFLFWPLAWSGDSRAPNLAANIQSDAAQQLTHT